MHRNVQGPPPATTATFASGCSPGSVIASMVTSRCRPSRYHRRTGCPVRRCCSTCPTDGLTSRCVARIEPQADAGPGFPTYDLPKQFRVIDLVARMTPVPVPTAVVARARAVGLGAPFFVMERIDGRGATGCDALHVRRQLALRRAPEMSRRRCSGPRSGCSPTSTCYRTTARCASGARPTGTDRPVPPPRGDRGVLRVGGGRRASRFPSSSEASPGWTSTWPADEGPAVLSWATAASATSCTETSNRLRCWIGRWPRRRHGRSTWHG